MDNGTIMQFFEWHLPSGMLWNKLRDEAENLANSGFSAIWIPPAYKGSAGASDVGYGTYDVWDLGEFDQKGTVPTKYGTKDELKAAIQALHEHGMNVYADVVLDHMMGADGQEQVEATKVYEDNRLQDTGQGTNTISVWTHFYFPGRAKKYSDFEWHWYHFHGTDWDTLKSEGGIYLFEGKSWDNQVDDENGNFDYLMGADIDLGNQEVVDELTRWGEWFVKEMDLDGFRFDAVKHMRAGFYKKWISDVRASAKEELFSVGEYWTGDISHLQKYIDETGGEFSLFDVPLHFHMYEAATTMGAYDMRSLFHGTLVERAPQLAVTFVDNHDTQPGQSLQSFIPSWFKIHSYALILLREAGYPCVFYADYYGFGNDSPQKDEPHRQEIDKLLSARRHSAYGPQHDYLDHWDVIGWTREGDDEHPDSGLAVLMTNATGGSKNMYVGKRHAGRKMLPVLGDGAGTVAVGEDGNAVFTVPDGSVQVWQFVPQN